MSSSLEINCTFTNIYFSNSILYCCEIYTIFDLPHSEVTVIYGDHKENMSNENVTAVFMSEIEVPTIPSGFDRFFPNLISLEVSKCKLKKLEQLTLKPFNKLQRLILAGNELNTFDSDAFDFNAELNFIDVTNNKNNSMLSNVLRSAKIVDSRKPPRVATNLEIASRLLKDDCVVNTTVFSENRTLKLSNLKLTTEISKMKSQIKTLKTKIDKLTENTKLPDKSLLTKSELIETPENLKFLETQFRQCLEEKKEISKGQNQIICEMFIHACNALNMKIFDRKVSVTFFTKDKIPVIARAVTKLVVYNQQTLFLPINFGEVLENLEDLNVVNSELLDVDYSVFSGLKLQSIILSSNKLKDLSFESFGTMRTLERLDLSFNQIEHIQSKAFEGLTGLKSLNLNNNRLSKLDVSNLNNIEHLFVKHNQLEFIIPFEAAKVKTVDFSDNKCVDLLVPRVTIEKLTKHLSSRCSEPIELKCYFKYLQGNYLCRLDDLDIKSSNLATMKISGQHLEGKTINDVLIVSIRNQKTSFLPSGLGKLFPNLETVIVDSSGLTKIGINDFEEMTKVRRLSIRNNSIESIEEGAFDKLVNLEYAYLPENKIESLPERAFHELSKLKSINLNNNKLRQLKANQLPKKNVITEFIVSRNQLEAIEPKILTLLRNAKIDFTKNLCIDEKYSHPSKYFEFFGKLSTSCAEGF